MIKMRICTLVLLCVACTRTYAQQGTEEESKKPPIHLFEVVTVTAEIEPQESPTTISEITAEQLRFHTVNNLGEALDLLPGVHFRVGRSKLEEQVTVRGFEQEKVLILMDGIPVSIPYEGQINLSDIPVQNIARIKLIKGVSSVLYGPNGMGGVINVITRQGEERRSFSAQYEGSQYATHNIQVGHGWKKGPLSYYAAFSHRESNGYPLARTFTLPDSVLASMQASPANPPSLPNVPFAPDSGSRDNSDYSRTSFTLTSALELNSNNTLGVSFEHYNNQYGIPPAPVYREHKKGFYYFPRYWRFKDWNRTMVNVLEESKISNSLTVKGRFFYDKYDNLLAAYDDPSYTTQNRIGPASGDSLYDDHDFGFSTYAFWKGIPKNELRASFNFRRDVHKSTFANSPTDRMSADTWSLGIEDEIQLSNRLTLTPGISFDTLNKRERYQQSTSLEPGQDVHSVSPQIGLRYAASARVSLFGSVGRKMRFPTMRNLYADGIIGPLGNPDLKEERTISVEIGTTVDVNERLKLSGSFFYNDIKNMISLDNQIGRFEQYPEASIAGFELTAGGRIGNSTHAYLAYAFLRARADSLVTITNQYWGPLQYRPEELPYRPSHQIDVELRHSFPFGLEANVNGAYFSKATYYDHYNPVDNRVLLATKGKLGGYVLLNAKVSQRLLGGSSVYFAVENLLNRYYETLYLFPSAGRTYRGGIRFSI